MEEILLRILKNELYITYEDEDTDNRLARIIVNAIPTMNYKLGANLDYSQNGIEQNLIIAYCVYVYNGCANQFDENYFNEIMQVRMMYEFADDEDE